MLPNMLCRTNVVEAVKRFTGVASSKPAPVGACHWQSWHCQPVEYSRSRFAAFRLSKDESLTFQMLTTRGRLSVDAAEAGARGDRHVRWIGSAGGEIRAESPPINISRPLSRRLSPGIGAVQSDMRS